MRKLAADDVPIRTTADRTGFDDVLDRLDRRVQRNCSMNFVKRDPAPLEAAGLRWLAEAGARVPSIISDGAGPAGIAAD